MVLLVGCIGGERLIWLYDECIKGVGKYSDFMHKLPEVGS